MSDIEELESEISNAVKLHGHLGPFLVIGVRIGNLAKGIFDVDVRGNAKLQVTVKTPLLTPFSCIIDGIQATTDCTIGNQRLKTENSRKEIAAQFSLQDSDKTLHISINPIVIGELTEKMAESATNEELATQIAFMPENRLFRVKTSRSFYNHNTHLAKLK